MKAKRISFGQGHGSLAHNNREFTAANVDPLRTPDNITFVCQPITEAYDYLFKESTERYNARQKRNDRKIGNYYEHIFGCKPCNTVKVNALDQKSFYEVVVQIGKREDSGIGTEDEQLVADCLKEYMEGFQNRNPNFYVFNAVLHMDEATPHLHFDYIPVGHNKRGQDVQNGIAQALKEMGYGGGRKAIARWRAAEIEVLNKICLEHGIKPLAPEKARGTLEVEEYKEQRRQADALAVQNTQTEYQLALKKTMLASTETQLAEQRQLLGDTREQVREATADLMEQTRKIEDGETELSEVKAKVSKAEQKFDDTTAKIEKIMNYLPNIVRDTKLEDRYHDLSGQLKDMMKSSMSIIKHKDGIISAVDELETIVKKSTDSAYKAAHTVYDLREYGTKTTAERDDALEKLKAVRYEKTKISSELQSVKSEVRRYSEVYAMLERIAPSVLERARELVQEQKDQQQREQELQQLEAQSHKKKK